MPLNLKPEALTTPNLKSPEPCKAFDHPKPFSSLQTLPRPALTPQNPKGTPKRSLQGSLKETLKPLKSCPRPARRSNPGPPLPGSHSGSTWPGSGKASLVGVGILGLGRLGFRGLGLKV